MSWLLFEVQAVEFYFVLFQDIVFMLMWLNSYVYSMYRNKIQHVTFSVFGIEW